MRNPETPTQNNTQEFSQPTFLKPLDQNLFQAILLQDLDAITKAIDAGGNVNAIEEGEDKKSMLMCAVLNATSKTLNILNYLMSCGADVNYSTPKRLSLINSVIFDSPCLSLFTNMLLDSPNTFSAIIDKFNLSILKKFHEYIIFISNNIDTINPDKPNDNFLQNLKKILELQLVFPHDGNFNQELANILEHDNNLRQDLENIVKWGPIINDIITSKEKVELELLEAKQREKDEPEAKQREKDEPEAKQREKNESEARRKEFLENAHKRDFEAYKRCGLVCFSALTIIGTGVLISPSTAFGVAVAAITIPTCSAVLSEFSKGTSFYNSCTITLNKLKCELKTDRDILTEKLQTNFVNLVSSLKDKHNFDYNRGQV